MPVLQSEQGLELVRDLHGPFFGTGHVWEPRD